MYNDALTEQEVGPVACPFFMPTERLEGGSWMHPSRLPLGSGWKGYCTAPGHEGEIPSDEQLQGGCNLGYASRCPRRPQDAVDSVRFAVTGESEIRVTITFVSERNHHPAEHGTLAYDIAPGRWASPHPDSRIQKMAECYLFSYLLRKSSPANPTTDLSPLP